MFPLAEAPGTAGFAGAAGFAGDTDGTDGTDGTDVLREEPEELLCVRVPVPEVVPESLFAAVPEALFVPVPAVVLPLPCVAVCVLCPPLWTLTVFRRLLLSSR